MIKLMMRSATPGLRFCAKRVTPVSGFSARRADRVSSEVLGGSGRLQENLPRSKKHRGLREAQVKWGTTLVAILDTVSV